MIYTCYEMIQDCREGKAEGWQYFITNYVPVVRQVLRHYSPDRGEALVDGALASVRAGWFTEVEPGPERQFVPFLRQKVLEAVETGGAAEVELDLETLREALAPLTVVEKEVAWLETMRYPTADAARMLRMDPATAEKVRERAAELIRGKVDRWRRTLLADNGLALGRAAAAQSAAECVTAQALLEMIDGRATWQQRREMERHITECWHCVDHFCRLHEVCDLGRIAKPLTEAEAEPYRQAFGIAAKKSLWRKVLGQG